MENEFKNKQLPYLREYRINGGNILDFVINNKIILELKAKDILTKEDYFQTQRYLQFLKLRLALLVNFRNKYLKPKRIVLIETITKQRFA